MWLRLRQIALVARDIEAVAADLRNVFGIEVAFVDPGVAVFGLQNRVFAIGSQFLEVVSPVQEGTAGGRYLAQRGGDGGYMVIMQCDDHPARKRHVEQLNIRKVAETDGRGHSIMQLHPKDTGGSFLEVDWHSDLRPDGAWPPAGPDWQKAVRTDVIRAITGVEIQGPDPEAIARRWSEVLELPVEREGATPALRLENATIRFVVATDGRGEGLGGIDVEATDRARLLAAARARDVLTGDDTVMICGTRFRVV